MSSRWGRDPFLLSCGMAMGLLMLLILTVAYVLGRALA